MLVLVGVVFEDGVLLIGGIGVVCHLVVGVVSKNLIAEVVGFLSDGSVHGEKDLRDTDTVAACYKDGMS